MDKQPESLYDIISKKLTGDNDETEVLKSMQSILCYGDLDTLKKALRKFYKPFFPVTHTQQRNALLFISFLCLHYDFDPIDFGIDDHDFRPKSSVSKENTLSKFLYIGNNAALANFKETYNDELSDYIDNVKKRIWVYDYLTYFYYNTDQLRAYEDTIEDLYKKIETKAQDQNIDYARVLALPILSSSCGDDIFQEAIIQMPFSIFKHICRCYQNDNLQYLFDQTEAKRGFFITNKPRRRYQFGLLDDYILNQYYRFDGAKNIFPEFVFVNMNIEQTKELYDSYFHHFRTKYLRPTYKIRFSYDKFHELTFSALDLITADFKKEDFVQTFSYKKTIHFSQYNTEHESQLRQKIEYLKGNLI